MIARSDPPSLTVPPAAPIVNRLVRAIGLARAPWQHSDRAVTIGRVNLLPADVKLNRSPADSKTRKVMSHGCRWDHASRLCRGGWSFLRSSGRARRKGDAQTPSPNEKIQLGLIGAGSRGNQLLDSFLPQAEVEIVAVADVDDRHASETCERIKKAKGNTPQGSRDYRAMLDRKDLDAVIIATPDHWHALPAIHAVLAGKDVYVEKPVAHNVAEGQAMLRAARKTGKIMAVGTQQRSSSHFQKAVEIVRSGKLGKVFWVQTWNYENISPLGLGKYPDCDPPSYVDYERWLGPAPRACIQSQPLSPAVSLVLRLRRRHDERLGRPPE